MTALEVNAEIQHCPTEESIKHGPRKPCRHGASCVYNHNMESCFKPNFRNVPQNVQLYCYMTCTLKFSTVTYETGLLFIIFSGTYFSWFGADSVNKLPHHSMFKFTWSSRDFYY